MKAHAFRLTKGQDLKKSLHNYCVEHQISAAVVLSLVGCVDQAELRMAGGKVIKNWAEDFEIVSCTGTISSGKAHLHVVFSDVDAVCYGGHLQEGCIVNTTCEVVLGELENYHFTREFDVTTGYKEIRITEKQDKIPVFFMIDKKRVEFYFVWVIILKHKCTCGGMADTYA